MKHTSDLIGAVGSHEHAHASHKSHTYTPANHYEYHGTTRASARDRNAVSKPLARLLLVIRQTSIPFVELNLV
jgi:hypothetical protein